MKRLLYLSLVCGFAVAGPKAQFVKNPQNALATRERAQLHAEKPEMVWARMAPDFTVTTIDGERISLDDLRGKVVLMDFWATWCGPCLEALPHIHQIAQEFQGQPLVILSVSLDSDEAKWKAFVARNNMTWLQYRDGGFRGPVSRLFNVNAIPHTFSIDAEGILQDEQIGDEAIEGKLKKLCARARALEEAPRIAANAGP
ncbi:MAG: TlpA family protein disulfide reductase [Silvibacterium sp.]|nr:TlpA family protein disulfide reductase [Silvibacterium sp.]